MLLKHLTYPFVGVYLYRILLQEQDCLLLPMKVGAAVIIFDINMQTVPLNSFCFGKSSISIRYSLGS